MDCYKEKYHFFVNPSAASGKAKGVAKELLGFLKKEGIEYVLHVPSSGEDMAKRIAKITSKDYISEQGQDTHMIILGGDGSLNVTISNIQNFEHTILSYIPLGSGNDFARGMGIGKEPMDNLLNILYRGKEVQLDYGDVDYVDVVGVKHHKRCMISCGVGYDADITEEVNRTSLKKVLNKLHLGTFTYLLIGIKQIFTKQCVGATIAIDGEVMEHMPGLFFCVGMIHPFEGGGVPFCPKADPYDGLLDVCLVRYMPRPKLALAVAMVYLKQLHRFNQVSSYRGKQMQLILDEPQFMHTDGEVPGKVKEVDIICRQGLRFVY